MVIDTSHLPGLIVKNDTIHHAFAIIPAMTQVYEIRNRNIGAIIGSEKIAAFARRHGLSDQQAEYLRQVRRGSRQMGGGFARTLEDLVQIEPGSLDREESNPELLDNSFVRKVAKEVSAREVPLQMQQTILYMLRTTPERPADIPE